MGVLNGHEAPVNCVRWIDSREEGAEGTGVEAGWPKRRNDAYLETDVAHLVSGSADATLRVWSWNGDHGKCVAVLQVLFTPSDTSFHSSDHGHTSSVTALAVHILYREHRIASVMIASCSSGPDVKIWKCECATDLSVWHLASTLTIESCIQHSAAMTSLPSPSDAFVSELIQHVFRMDSWI